MGDTMLAEPAPAPRKSTIGDKLRLVSFTLGEVLITLGLIVILFVVYEVWITGIFSREKNHQIAQKLERKWDDPTLALPGSGGSTIPLGSGVANIYIPRLGSDYHWTIVEGTGADQLDEGPGHYRNSAQPGAVGNFGVAGHRVGKGEPFLNLDKLRVDDPVIIETRTSWIVYRVMGAPAGSDPQDSSSVVNYKGGSVRIPGREIVVPSAGKVLDPVPDHNEIPQSDATERLMTMTTCHPKFTAEKRMIVHAVFAGSYSALDAAKEHVSTMPAAIQALYSQANS